MKQPLRIGIFDSGIGGLTVVQHLHDAIPHCHIVYCADTAHTPYGSRSPQQVTELSLAITRFLCEQDVDIIVIACGTASACAREAIADAAQRPVFDVMTPLAEKTAANHPFDTIALLATPTTIASEVLANTIRSKAPNTTLVPLPCPRFVPMLEQELIDPATVEEIVRETLSPLGGYDLDAALLGCTHYPLLTAAVSRQLGNIPVIDLSQACAQAVIDTVNQTNSCSETYPEIQPEIYVSANPSLFASIAERVIAGASRWPVHAVDWNAKVSV